VWLLATKGEKMAQTDDTVIWDLAFQVEDIKQAVEGFKSKGAPVAREPGAGSRVSPRSRATIPASSSLVTRTASSSSCWYDRKRRRRTRLDISQ
jgi:hypothetical protein